MSPRAPELPKSRPSQKHEKRESSKMRLFNPPKSRPPKNMKKRIFKNGSF
jgi:hypothetical protein